METNKEIAGMHAEYRVEVCTNGCVRVYADSTTDSLDRARDILRIANRYLPEKKGYKNRIAVRPVGDWCEMKEEK